MPSRTRKSVTNVFSVFLKRLSWVLSGHRLDDENLKSPLFAHALRGETRSLFIRHLDCGSCNGCELELSLLTNPVYDAGRYGVSFVASPRHADALVMTGAFTRNLEEAALATLQAMPKPHIIAIGDCAIDGGIFRDSYAVVSERPTEIMQAMRATVPGCPPPPDHILSALLDLDLKRFTPPGS